MSKPLTSQILQGRNFVTENSEALGKLRSYPHEVLENDSSCSKQMNRSSRRKKEIKLMNQK